MPAAEQDIGGSRSKLRVQLTDRWLTQEIEYDMDMVGHEQSPSKSQIALVADGKWSVRKPPASERNKGTSAAHRLYCM